MGFSLSRLFGGDSFDYGAQARSFMQALERQNQINAGMKNVNKVFGQFDNNFYDGRRQAMVDYYSPQIDNQYADAQRQLTYALARSGGAQSSAAASQRADLERKAMAARQNIMDQADASTQNMRNSVEAARSDIVGMLNQSGNASTAMDSARSRVAALSAPQSYSPLGDLFSTGAGIAGQQKALEDSFNASNGLTAAPRYWIFGNDQTRKPWQPSGAVANS